jgi:hypothetical protein
LPDATTFNAATLPTWTPNGTDGIYLWGAQRELGDTPTAYIENGAFAPSTTPLAANPTSNGLLIEEARTNRILWCRDATQANWVKTNVTPAKDQTGVDGVANAASSLTATANDGTCIQTITLASGSRTGSVYLKRLTGTGNVQVSLDGTTYSTVDLSTTEWRRIVLSGTVTNPTVGIKLAVSGDAVAMDYAHVEDGAFVTTPILTTAATATRSADVASISVENCKGVFKNPAQGAFVAKFNGFTLPLNANIFFIRNSAGLGFLQFSNVTGSRMRVQGSFSLDRNTVNDAITIGKNTVSASWGKQLLMETSSLSHPVIYPRIAETMNEINVLVTTNATTSRLVFYPTEQTTNQLQNIINTI